MSQTFFFFRKTSVYTYHHGTVRSQCWCGCASVCIRVSRRSTPFRRKSCHKHLVDHQSESIKSRCVSTYSLVQEKNPSKCRRLQSTVGTKQSHTSGPTGSEGEAHTCSTVSSVAWVSHSTETNKHTCSHTPAITLHTKKKNDLEAFAVRTS